MATPLWNVTAQRSGTQLAASGIGFDDVWIVDFRINVGPAAGTRATVRIPLEFATPDKVRETIDAEFERLSGIGALGNA